MTRRKRQRREVNYTEWELSELNSDSDADSNSDSNSHSKSNSDSNPSSTSKSDSGNETSLHYEEVLTDLRAACVSSAPSPYKSVSVLAVSWEPLSTDCNKLLELLKDGYEWDIVKCLLPCGDSSDTTVTFFTQLADWVVSKDGPEHLLILLYEGRAMKKSSPPSLSLRLVLRTKSIERL